MVVVVGGGGGGEGGTRLTHMVTLCVDSTDKVAESDGGDIQPEDYEITEKFEMVSRISKSGLIVVYMSHAVRPGYNNFILTPGF